ncbi:MAG: hypothetical protein M3Q94_12740 [Pseudomonadota bacterium]|nr:hypothetical protein [Pseudomonadota bacterium]
MTSFSVSDGTIEKITCEYGSISIEFVDWQEERWTITFENVLGFKSIGAVGAEVSEMLVKDETPFSQELALIDPSEVGFNYCFTSARDWNVVLIVVANGYTVKKCS